VYFNLTVDVLMSDVGRQKFVLVSFDDGTISLVSSSWLIGNGQCYWPRTNQIKLAQKHAAVDETWLKCSCRILTSSGRSPLMVFNLEFL